MKKIMIMMVAVLALSTASFAAAEEMASQPVAEQAVAETSTPEAIAIPEAAEGQSAVEPVVPPEAETAKRPPIREKFNAENTAEFGDLFPRAMEYERMYSELGKNLSPWIVTVDVLNEKNIFGWRKAPWKAVPPMPSVTIAPQTGWMMFTAVANTKTPEGWVMTMEPRDVKLAGFRKITITADQQDIVTAEIK